VVRLSREDLLPIVGMFLNELEDEKVLHFRGYLSRSACQASKHDEAKEGSKPDSREGWRLFPASLSELPS